MAYLTAVTQTFTGQNVFSQNAGSTYLYTLGVTGTPYANSTASLIRAGNAISGGNSSVNGGTYLGINEPSSGSGSVADFLDLQNANNIKLELSSAGNLTVAGTYNTNTFNGNTLTFGSASTATVSSASGQALTITANAASTWSTSAGNLSVQAAGTNTLALDTGGAGTANFGASNASTINVGNANSATALTVQGGTGSSAVVVQAAAAGQINIATNNVANKLIDIGSVGSTAQADTIHIADTTGNAIQGIYIGSNGNTSSTTTINGGGTTETVASSGISDQLSADSAAAFLVQGTTTTILNVDTLAADALNSVTINSGVSGDAGLELSQVTASAGCSGFCDLLGVNTSGQVGVSNAAVSLTSPALAYWDGLNDPTTGDQSYPTDPIAAYTCSGTCTGTGGTGGFNSGNGELLNPAQTNTYGSLNWSFAQVPFEEIQFQVKTTACSLNCSGLTSGADASWFYGYADSVPTTEFGCNVAVGSCNGTNNIGYGYIIYFSEYH
ncbi:MAG: hypothetical protein ACREF7_00210, partial [Candidatus Saccharimonadales bacterium]